MAYRARHSCSCSSDDGFKTYLYRPFAHLRRASNMVLNMEQENSVPGGVETRMPIAGDWKAKLKKSKSITSIPRTSSQRIRTRS